MIGTPVTLAELAAAILGMLPEMRGGFVKMLVWTLEIWVAIEEVEFDLVGDEGRAVAKAAVVGGDGAARELEEFRC